MRIERVLGMFIGHQIIDICKLGKSIYMRMK